MSAKSISGESHFRTLECPIELQYMKKPVIDLHGHTFSQSAIDKMKKKRGDDNDNLNSDEGFICPFTNEWVQMKSLYPNRMVKDITDELQGGLEKKIAGIVMAEVEYTTQQIRAEYNKMITEQKNNIAVTEKKYEILLEQASQLIQEQKRVNLEQSQDIKEKIITIDEKDGLINEQEKKKNTYFFGGLIAGALTTGIIFYSIFKIKYSRGEL